MQPMAFVSSLSDCPGLCNGRKPESRTYRALSSIHAFQVYNSGKEETLCPEGRFAALRLGADRLFDHSGNPLVQAHPLRLGGNSGAGIESRFKTLFVEQIGMSSCARNSQNKHFLMNGVNQQPIGQDVAFPESGIFTCQRVIPVFRIKRLFRQ
jgi:hypothetical protein